MASALLMVLLFLGDLVLVTLQHRGDMYLHILSDGCALLAWLLHFAAMLVLQKSGLRRSRGPPALLLLVLLSVPNLVFLLEGDFWSEASFSPSEPLRVARFALAFTRTLPLVVYIVAFAFPCIGDSGYALHINAADEAPLIPQSSHPDTGEMVAEDGSGCVSRLFYLWLDPLLRRGQRGELGRPCDVYCLPQKLRVSVVQRYFHSCWEASQRGAGAPDRPRDLWPRPVSRNLLNGSWTSPDEEESMELRGEVGLLRVLHKAFGPHYYALGGLKLVGNLLGFAGPLLLSSLVGFMEDKSAPFSQGAWITLGLFSSTFLSAFLRNIFSFQVSKVGLSARAALVTAIYGKALRVGCGGLVHFTLGEVVNFMSTDTDRVVNFFNSFHELWSLPVQFSIALYLLYLQVGLAFLGGLGVALLLVPLNKVLASRILDNNKHMLGYKDSRVKVRPERSGRSRWF